ncbi:MAG: hypothetical protein ACOX86_01090 [Pelotomaculaceae bacterium]|jgi:hypothetical protein|nr:hypothetical protein [Bacillota bacterium]
MFKVVEESTEVVNPELSVNPDELTDEQIDDVSGRVRLFKWRCMSLSYLRAYLPTYHNTERIARAG